jgi:4'-phosphopantetheinyl transferase EntD
MTHCSGYRAAAVARRCDVHAIGIDAEPHAPLPDGVDTLVMRPEEQSELAALAAWNNAICWDRLLFSAKESVYKAWFPLTGCLLDFAEARLRLDVAGGFTAQLLVDSGVSLDREPLRRFAGRWLVRDGLIVTAITVTRHRH